MEMHVAKKIFISLDLHHWVGENGARIEKESCCWGWAGRPAEIHIIASVIRHKTPGIVRVCDTTQYTFKH